MRRLRSTEAYSSGLPAIWGGSGPQKHIAPAGPPYGREEAKVVSSEEAVVIGVEENKEKEEKKEKKKEHQK